MGRVIFDELAWWHRPRWQIAAAGATTTAAIAVWWFVLAPAEPQAIVPRASNAPVMAARPGSPPIEAIAPPLPAAANEVVPSPPTKPSLSTLVAPGVHVTPLSVPPGTEPMPAGPSEHDSEPEN